MARIAYTRELYDKLVAGYRESPGNHQRCGRFAGVFWRTAKHAWVKGWPALPWARPIQTVLAEEGDAAKVRAQELARRAREVDDAEREKGRREHIETLAEEANVQKAMRKDVLSAAVLIAEMVPAVRGLARIVMGSVLEREDDGSFNLKQPRYLQAPTVPPALAMKMMASFVTMAGKVAYAGEVVIQLGRLERGQSNVNLGVTDMSEEQAMEELAAAAEIHNQLKLAEEASGEPLPPGDLH